MWPGLKLPDRHMTRKNQQILYLAYWETAQIVGMNGMDGNDSESEINIFLKERLIVIVIDKIIFAQILCCLVSNIRFLGARQFFHSLGGIQ